MTQFLESNGLKRGGMAGGAYNGKILRMLLNPQMLERLGQHLGEEAKIYIDYLHSLREFYSILVDKTLHLELAYKRERKYRECFQVLHEACGLSETLKQHVLMNHCVEFLQLTGQTLKYFSDEIVETSHGKLHYFEKKHNYHWKHFVGPHKSARSKGSFDLWNAKHAKFNVSTKVMERKLRQRKIKRYFEGQREQLMTPTVPQQQHSQPQPQPSGQHVQQHHQMTNAHVAQRPNEVGPSQSPQPQDGTMAPQQPQPSQQPQQQQPVMMNPRPQQQYYNLTSAQQQPGGQPRLQHQIRQQPMVRQLVQSGTVVVKTGPPGVRQPQKQIQVPQVISGQPGISQQTRPIVIRGQHPGRNYIIRSAGVFSSRPPAAVLQHPMTLSRPPPADILSRLQSLTPIRPTMTRLLNPLVKESATETFDVNEFLKEFDYPQSNDVDILAQVRDTFDESEFLRQFDNLQSHNLDILAQALELSSISLDSNVDLLSEAMKLSEISDEMNMDF